MTRPLLSATLICKNEAHNVERCLDSLNPHVDEICVADTGSTDATIAEFKRYAAKHKFPKGRLKLRTFTDCNDENGDIYDFSMARQAADDLATGEWVVWADMDDIVTGMATLREYAAKADDSVVAFFCQYSYARTDTGETISELWRERVVRNNGTPWTGRLHEHKLFTQGAIVKVPPEIAEWVHHRDHTQRTGERNLRVLEKWDQDEPDNPRIVSSIAMEYMGEERHKDASDAFERYLAMPGEPPDRRAQASRHLSIMLMMQGRVEEARHAALRSLGELWTWPDTHLTLAEVEQTVGRPDVAMIHARQALELGKPDTLLIVNPLQYTAHPRALMAVCLAQMGRFEEACAMAEEGLAIAPSYPLIVEHLPGWRAQLKRVHTLGAFLACADTLVEAGEPLKAQALLDAVPFYVAGDPQVIGKRVQIVRLIEERRRAPKVAAEDPAADLFVERHMNAAA